MFGQRLNVIWEFLKAPLKSAEGKMSNNSRLRADRYSESASSAKASYLSDAASNSICAFHALESNSVNQRRNSNSCGWERRITA